MLRLSNRLRSSLSSSLRGREVAFSPNATPVASPTNSRASPTSLSPSSMNPPSLSLHHSRTFITDLPRSTIMISPVTSSSGQGRKGNSKVYGALGAFLLIPAAVYYKSQTDVEFNYKLGAQFPTVARCFNVTSEMDKSIQALFESFDIDGDGHITARELQNAFGRVSNHVISEEEVEAMIEYADATGDHRLNYREFYNLMVELQSVQEKFNQFDSDADGFISKDELKQAMHSMGFFLSEDDLVRVISEVDLDSDGQISFDEYARWAMKKAKVKNAHH